MGRDLRLARLVAFVLTCAAAACGHEDAHPPANTTADVSPTRVDPRPASPDESRSSAFPAQAAAFIRGDRGHVVFEQHADILATPVLAGSLAKLVTMRAARDTGVVTANTRLTCARALRVDDRTLDCVHPPLGHALSADEALAHSCNSVLMQIAARITPSAWSRAATAIGLPPLSATASWPLSAIGLDGVRATPRQWLDAVTTLVRQEGASGSGSLILEGMRLAVRDGTAAALGDAGFAGYAKTGTAPMPGGGTMGLVVFISRPDALSGIVLAPGASGRDAASLAATLIQQTQRLARPPTAASPAASTASSDGPATPTVSVGVAVHGEYAVRAVPLEDYVAGVVDAEAPADAAPVLRRTLAILARTWAQAHRGRHANEGFDLCDLTHCQVYRPAQSTGVAAASATRGIVLRTTQGALVDSEYSASCGGRLASGVEDPAGTAHRDAWRSDVTEPDLRRALRLVGASDARIEHVHVVARDRSGRARIVRVVSDRVIDVDADRFRQAVGRTLGWHVLKSTWFDVSSTSRGVAFDGRGFGHGRGLCVTGARVLHDAGRREEDVLRAYFQQASLVSDTTRVSVMLPPSQAYQRPALEQRVRRAAAVVALRLEMPPPSDVAVVLHPTVEAFQREAGAAWWMAARTRGTRIDMLPIDVLTRRGSLDARLRHELVHVLTADALQGRPQWVHEGLARFIAGERVGGVASPACPADDAFLVATASALPRAYDAALGCVERALARDGHWRDLGR